MPRPTLQISSLHGHTIEELVDLRNNTSSKYSRLVLTVIIMKYHGREYIDFGTDRQ